MISSLLTPLVRGLIEVGGAIAPTPLPSAYVANGFEPDYVADFSATSADYFRVAGSDSDFATAFTSDSEGGGLATMTDSSGNLVRRPHNQARGSQSIGDATWTASNVTTTQNAAVAPDGTTTASNIVPTGSGVSHYEFQSGPDAEINLGKVARVFVKANGYGYFQIATGNSGDGYVNINLSSGAVTDSGRMSGSATAYGNGWYLLEATGFINDDVFLCPRPDDGAKLATFDADGSSGVLAWGYHLTREDLGGMANNPDAAAGFETYVPTTTAARYLTRRRHHRWDGAAWVPTLLHEPVGATNLISTSKPATATWTQNSTTISAATGVTGIDGVSGSPVEIVAGSGGSSQFAPAPSGFSAQSGVVWAIAKDAGTGGYLGFAGLGIGAASEVPIFDLVNGTVDFGATSTIVTGGGIIPWDGTGWYLCYITVATSTGAPSIVVAQSATDNTSSAYTYTGDDSTSIYVAHVQAETSALPSSPIPTNGSTVPRAADTLKGKAASLPYSSTAISMAVKGRYSSLFASFESFLSWYQDGDDRAVLQVGSGNAQVVMQTGGDSTESAQAGAVPTGASASVSVAGRFVSGGEIQCALNGSAGTAESATTPSMPPLSDNDLLVSRATPSAQLINGTVDTIRLWDEDIAEAGIESGSAGVEIQGLPTISGTEAVGSTLTASAATVVGGPSPSTTWQWQRSANGTSGWADISGATSSTYTLVSADEDQYVRAVQTATVTAGGDTYTDSANSVASGQIQTSAATLPLDGVSNVLAAYSTAFQLRTAYTGDGVRVRRSSDNTEQDIGFTGAGELDQSALTTFTGANNGFVATIYDQSGSALDVDQATAAEQPQIVTSGSVENINGEPAPDFGGTSILEAASPVGGNRTSLYVAAVFEASTPWGWAAGSSDAGLNEESWRLGGTTPQGVPNFDVIISEDGARSVSKRYRQSVSSGFHVLAFGWSSGTLTLYIDGVAATSPVIIDDDSFTTLHDTTSPFVIGALLNTGSPVVNLPGQLAEVIVVGDATDRVAIEQSMLDRYGISGTAS